jgi:hypothetical protein
MQREPKTGSLPNSRYQNSRVGRGRACQYHEISFTRNVARAFTAGVPRRVRPLNATSKRGLDGVSCDRWSRELIADITVLFRPLSRIDKIEAPNSHSTSIALKRLTEPFHFKTGAKQREQTPHQNHSAPGGQEDVGFPAQRRKMPENDNGE